MSVESPPAFQQAASFGAEQTRRVIASLLARGASIGSIVGGLVGATDCALTPPGSGMSVNVAPGELWVPGSSSATQSGYYCRVSSSTNLTIAASDPTSPRVDTVIGQVQDAAYTGSTNSFQVAVVTGTPTPGATLGNLNGKGAVPASSLVLGYVLVPNGASNVVSADIANVATPALFGLGGSLLGASIVGATQATSSTSYTTLATPDEVTVVLPTNGLIALMYQAQYSVSGGGSPSGQAAVFLGANQLQGQGYDGTTRGPATQCAELVGTPTSPLFSFWGGLMGVSGGGSYGADVTTGQIVGYTGAVNSSSTENWGAHLNGSAAESGNLATVPGVGGPCYIFAAAGTYTVSVQFKAGAGSTVTAENRKLWVQALSFA